MSLSRREFLKALAAVLGAAALVVPGRSLRRV